MDITKPWRIETAYLEMGGKIGDEEGEPRRCVGMNVIQFPRRLMQSLPADVPKVSTPEHNISPTRQQTKNAKMMK